MKFVEFWNKHALNRFACLALTIWVSHFYHFRDFGFYEDDYAHVTPAIGWTLTDLFNYSANVFATWPQGRPLNFFLPQFFSFIGTQLAGLHVTYLISFFIITINAFLFYTLLKRVSRESTAFIGALAFCLFPADTTHIFLTHAFHLQTSLTFLLIASHYYLSGKRVLPYLLILGSLLAYESPFMVFFGIPLLKNEIKWDRSFRKEIIRHIAILSGIVLFIFIFRTSLGEERVMEMGSSFFSMAKIPIKMAGGIVMGPVVSLALFLYGPILTIFYWNSQLSIVFIASLGLFIWILRQLTVDTLDEKQTYQITFRSRIFTYNGDLEIPSSYLHTAKLFLAATIMLFLAYILSFTHFPPITQFGRGTSVHLAATFGGALLFSCICSIILSIANTYRLKSYAILGIALYLSLVVAYRFSIQLDFQKAWQNQRVFWTSALNNLPDITDGTVIFVLNHNLPETQYIVTNSWANPIILRQLFRFPTDWQNPPRLFVVQSDWTNLLTQDGDQVKWEVPVAAWPSHWEVLPNSNMILLEMENGALVRKFGTVNINGQDFQLKPLPADATLNFERRSLYNYLIIDKESYPLPQLNE